jgi:hypothetical protein
MTLHYVLLLLATSAIVATPFASAAAYAAVLVSVRVPKVRRRRLGRMLVIWPLGVLALWPAMLAALALTVPQWALLDRQVEGLGYLAAFANVPVLLTGEVLWQVLLRRTRPE